MASVTGADGVTHDDGGYSGFCQREKSLRTFTGVVWLDETGRVLVTGLCHSCNRSITVTLYSA